MTRSAERSAAGAWTKDRAEEPALNDRCWRCGERPSNIHGPTPNPSGSADVFLGRDHFAGAVIIRPRWRVKNPSPSPGAGSIRRATA
jgi:hypothetical protein